MRELATPTNVCGLCKLKGLRQALTALRSCLLVIEPWSHQRRLFLVSYARPADASTISVTRSTATPTTVFSSTVSPGVVKPTSTIPNYAAAYSSAARYSSTCSCVGVAASTFTTFAVSLSSPVMSGVNSLRAKCDKVLPSITTPCSPTLTVTTSDTVTIIKLMKILKSINSMRLMKVLRMMRLKTIVKFNLKS